MSLSVVHRSSVVKVQRSVEGDDKRRACWQVGVLLAFLILSLASYTVLIVVAPQLDRPIGPFLVVWGSAFLLYLAACLWIMKTRRLSGRGYWLELGMLLAGALLFRVMLLPLPLGLSRDAWRYLWDGRLILHGVNPYLYAPTDAILLSLRDTIVFPNTPYGATPTVYPPLAQLFFVVGALLMPTNLLATKALFVLCDLITCLGVVWLLMHKKMDPRRAIVYAWCPLPIVEFAVQGHVDAVVVMWSVLALVCALGSWRGARLCAGVCLGLATLAKLYPLILLLALVRQRDWPLFVACVLTILLGYLPFMVLSNGHPLAPFLASVSQVNQHPAILPLLLFTFESSLHTHWLANTLAIEICTIVVLLPVCLIVIIQRLRKRLGTEMAVLFLLTGFLLASAQLNPWYVAALLPWLALLLSPVWHKQRLQVRGLALAGIWYCTFAIIVSYLVESKLPLPIGGWLLALGASVGIVLLGWGMGWLLWRVLKMSIISVPRSVL